MSFQYNEYYNGTTGLTVGVNRILFSEQSPYQKVEVFETDTWGNLLTIDGMVMLSEKDEFVYHEMMTHVGLFSHPNPKRVLIIGGGDGGSAREVLRHPEVEQVDMVEIDEAVVRASRQYLPEVGDFENPRLKVHYEDGAAFVRNVKEPYDVIIVDGSDPVGPAEGLFSKAFYDACYNALTETGVLTAQTESPWVPAYHRSISDLFAVLGELFAVSRMYLASIPLYPTGLWSMAFAGKGSSPLSEETLRRVRDGIPKLNAKLRYYNMEVHQGAFAIPGFIKKLLPQ